MKRHLGIDYGKRFIGLALSDTDGKISIPYMIIPNEGNKVVIHKLFEIIKERNITCIVIGLPINMNGSEGKIAKEIKSFGKRLKERTGVDVIFFDERFTTDIADEVLIQSGMGRGERRQKVHSLSASIILQGYLKFKETD